MFKPKRKNDIDALLGEMQSQYPEIEKLYNASLYKKEIDSNLKIKIKSFLENAKSVLDYCAHDVAEAVGISTEKIYFPIVEKDKNINSFNGSVGRNLPGLEEKNKQIFDYFESIQPYHPNFSWLADFATVSIDNKHSQLTPQTKTETERITSTHSGGGQVSWNPNSVRFGSGVLINGAPVNPFTQMPVPTPETTVTKEIWVDFRFTNTISALSLLKTIHSNVPEIVSNVYKIL